MRTQAACVADGTPDGLRDGASRAVAADLARRRFGQPVLEVGVVLGQRHRGSMRNASARIEAAGAALLKTIEALAKKLANA